LRKKFVAFYKIPLVFPITLREMLTCAQVEKPNVKIVYWNACIKFNL